jgi:hypothetical protein
MGRRKLYNSIYEKKESNKFIYLVCSKRGNKSNFCPGKAKYDKATGIMSIYEKCKNNNNDHNIIEYESFKDQIMKNREENIDINLKFYQKYYI